VTEGEGSGADAGSEVEAESAARAGLHAQGGAVVAAPEGVSSLASLPLPVLENALKAIKSGAVLVPVSEAALRAVHLEPLVLHLPALAVFTTQAALCGVFELLAAHARAEAARPRPEIVWSGPQTVHERSRQTAIVFRELLESAKRHIFIAGYSFDGGAHLTGLAHAAMRERNVKCEIVIDCSGVRIHDDPSPANVLARCPTSRAIILAFTVSEYIFTTNSLLHSPLVVQGCGHSGCRGEAASILTEGGIAWSAAFASGVVALSQSSLAPTRSHLIGPPHHRHRPPRRRHCHRFHRRRGHHRQRRLRRRLRRPRSTATRRRR